LFENLSSLPGSAPAAFRQIAPHAAGLARPGGISGRSRIAVKGLTALHVDAVDKMTSAGKPEIVADAA
jgi:hypothetical protein